jgi:hypothetical protein
MFVGMDGLAVYALVLAIVRDYSRDRRGALLILARRTIEISTVIKTTVLDVMKRHVEMRGLRPFLDVRSFQAFTLSRRFIRTVILD